MINDDFYKDPKYKDILPAYIECGDGWNTLIQIFLDIILDMKKQIPNYTFKVTCIKEKFGLLRIYYSVLDEDDHYDSAIHDRLDHILSHLEFMSEHICEDCGKPGTYRNDLWWIRTLCDEHYEQMKEGMKNGKRC